jgi:hypothetical protein
MESTRVRRSCRRSRGRGKRTDGADIARRSARGAARLESYGIVAAMIEELAVLGLGLLGRRPRAGDLPAARLAGRRARFPRLRTLICILCRIKESALGRARGHRSVKVGIAGVPVHRPRRSAGGWGWSRLTGGSTRLLDRRLCLTATLVLLALAVAAGAARPSWPERGAYGRQRGG